jgi:hypothetical protein
MQQFLKPATRPARAWVVAAELLEKFLVAVDDPVSALYARFGGIAALTLARGLETEIARCAWTFSWRAS